MRLKHLLILTLTFVAIGCANRPGPLSWKPDQQSGLLAIDAVDAKERAELREALLTLQRVHFKYNSAELTEDSRSALVDARAKLAGKAHVQLFVEGHADERGTTEYNISLGEKRAMAVTNYLNALGIDGDRLHPVSFGEEKPLVAEHHDEAWAKNRRVDFRLLRGDVEIVVGSGHTVAMR